MLQIKNTLGGGKPEGLYVWKKNSIETEQKVLDKSVSTLGYALTVTPAVIYNNEIHILGSGYNGDYTKHYKWDGSTWTSASTLPYSDFRGGSAVVYNNEIHILGGTNNLTKHYKWDGSTWTSVSTLPYSFRYGSAVVYNNEIHILGSMNSLTAHYKWNGNSWTKVSTLPYEFRGGCAVVFNGEIHVLGTNSNSSYYKYHYKWDGTSWTSVSTLPYNFMDGCAVVFNGAIHILGTSYDSTYYKYHYKWDGNSWVSVSTLPYYFYKGASVVYNNELHILGGGESGTGTNHYIIIGNVPVYTFLDYIVSDKETAYPDGGEKGGYWYEKIGDAKIASGTITLSSKQSTISIEHGLGKTPTKFAIMPINKNFNSVYTLCAMGIDDTIIMEYYDSLFSTPKGYFTSVDKSKVTMNETNITLPGCYVASQSSTFQWIAGTYHWMAIAE